MLDKTVKPKLETSTFWCLQGFSPNSLKKEAHCCLEQSGKGDTHPELFGKRKGETEDWGKREFPGSTHKGFLVTLLSMSFLPEASTGALEGRGDLHSWAMEIMKEVLRDLIVCLSQTWLEGSET
jgi:hypothetical protein